MHGCQASTISVNVHSGPPSTGRGGVGVHGLLGADSVVLFSNPASHRRERMAVKMKMAQASVVAAEEDGADGGGNGEGEGGGGRGWSSCRYSRWSDDLVLHHG